MTSNQVIRRVTFETEDATSTVFVTLKLAAAREPTKTTVSDSFRLFEVEQKV